MLKRTYIYLLAIVLGLGLSACSDDDKGCSMPAFGTIEVTPAQSEYHVGDVVSCSIRMLTPAGESLQEATYWWYASWWFSDPNLKADFSEADDSGVFTSEPIELTEAGDVTLYFFGRVQFPRFDWRKVEIGRTITVVE